MLATLFIIVTTYIRLNLRRIFNIKDILINVLYIFFN